MEEQVAANEQQQQQDTNNEKNTTVDTESIEVMNNGEMVEEEAAADTQETQEDGDNKADETSEREASTEYKNAQESMSNAAKVLAEKGIDYQALEQDYLENGTLSEENFKTLEKAGYPKTVVNAILAGWQATADNYYNVVVNSAGGADVFNNIKEYVKGQGDEAIETFNQAMNQGNVNLAKAYLAGVKAEMVSKYGTSNPSLTGSASPNNGLKGYANQSEMIAAINDRRYLRDPMYQKEVEKRIALTEFM